MMDTIRAGWRRALGASWAILLCAGALSAQEALPQGSTADKKPYNPPPVFSSQSIVEFTLHAPFGKLRRDREVETEYRPAFITYNDFTSGPTRVPLRVRTRGIWRKANCQIPPLMFNFTKDSTKGTLFGRMDRVRFSFHCRDTDEYEQYVLQEHQLYRVQQLLTPLAFAVRLVRVTFVDSESNDTLTMRYSFLQEIDEEFAQRQDMALVDQRGAGPSDLDPYESALFGVLQYFVGNSDYSIRALHNVVLLLRQPYHFPVARDFDWSGAVSARYAKPNPVLNLRHVSQRVMRGYCAPPEEYEKVFQLFRDRKDAMYALYSDSLNQAMKPDVVKRTLGYFDAFYETINDPKRAQRQIVGACLGGSAN
jgi:hypothetical protein